MINRKKRWYDIFGLGPRGVMKALCILSIIPIAIAIAMISYAWRASEYDISRISAPLESCAAYDVDGKMIGSLDGEGRSSITRSELPKHLVQAFIAREDEDFYEHHGVVYSSLMRSILRNITTFSYAQGASTITMQLARNTFELWNKSIDRKFLEMAIARRIEDKFDKDAILTAYLNRIYFGEGYYGIAQAARGYFGKSVSQLNCSESATLAGIIRGPSLFNPVSNYNAAIRERNSTLDRMESLEFLTAQETAKIKEEELRVISNTKKKLNSYPIMLVMRELAKMHPEEGADTASILVLTSLKLPLQRQLEESIDKIFTAAENDESDKVSIPKLNDSPQNAPQVAAAIIESSTGNILAISGGRSPVDGIDRWMKNIRPGSAFLPLVNCKAAEMERNIIRNSPLQTGRAIGYRPIIELCRNLQVESTLPSAEELYEGNFELSMVDLVRILVTIQQQGYLTPSHLIQQVSSCEKSLLYTGNKASVRERQEIIPREAARIAAPLAPYSYDPQARLASLTCTLPENNGFLAAYQGRSRSVFVWVGFDTNEPEHYAVKGLSKKLRMLTTQLASQLYDSSLTQMKDEQAAKKETHRQSLKKQQTFNNPETTTP